MKGEKFLLFVILAFIFTQGCSKREEERSYDVNEKFFENEETKEVDIKEKKELGKLIVSLRKNPFLRWEEEKGLVQKKMRKVIDYLDLTAIFCSPLRSFAVINGYVVEKGDVIAEKEVIEINPKSVILEDEKGEYILPLRER